MRKEVKKETANRVLDECFSASSNFYHSDKMLRHYLDRKISQSGRTYMAPRWERTGKAAAGRMNELSQLADKKGPELIKRNFLGETINEIRFHPAYEELLKIAVDSEMLRVKWEPELRQHFRGEYQRLGFVSSYLYCMSELGQYCPLCMTDGVARLLDRFGAEADCARLLPHIFTNDPEEFYTGAMFLTEKAGGSDVGANLVRADHVKDDWYSLHGEKWFCSNVNGEIIFVLGRTEETVEGTRGLSIFLVEKWLEDGRKNPLGIIRLKDKLGVRSMASAECLLDGTLGKRVGEEFGGFKIMTEMINLSRIHAGLSSLAAARRALVEAWQFLSHRRTFGRRVTEHALIRTKFSELACIHTVNFYLIFRAVEALDQADAGDKRAEALLRILTPMLKRQVCESSVYLGRESMELMGGLGYIEDGVMPKLVRDLMVNPIWEGAGNIMLLDMLRAMAKSEGLQVMGQEILRATSKNTEYGPEMEIEWQELSAFSTKLAEMPQESREATALPFFSRLARLYQMALLIEICDENSRDWIVPALRLLRDEKYKRTELTEIIPMPLEEVQVLMAWD